VKQAREIYRSEFIPKTRKQQRTFEGLDHPSVYILSTVVAETGAKWEEIIKD